MSKNAKRFSKDASINTDYNVSSITSAFGYNKWELTKEQKQLGNVMIDNDLVFVTGRAGCGKTSGVLYHYIKEYLNNNQSNIVVIRTPVEAGMDKIGALPSGLSEKIEPHFMPAKKILNDLLNAGKVQCDMDKRIHFKIPNFCLGDTLDDSFIIISEAQQIPPMIMKLLLERIGKRSKCIVEGDPSQLYANDGKRNGLSHSMGVFFDSDGNCKFSNRIAKFEFVEKVNQRSEVVAAVNNAYEEAGL